MQLRGRHAGHHAPLCPGLHPEDRAGGQRGVALPALPPRPRSPHGLGACAVVFLRGAARSPAPSDRQPPGLQGQQGGDGPSPGAQDG